MGIIDWCDLVSVDEVHQRTEALNGAFAEGVDLGPRGAQIRALGGSMATMIEALRLRLTSLSGQLQIDATLLDLDQLTRVAEAARTYEIVETDR